MSLCFNFPGLRTDTNQRERGSDQDGLPDIDQRHHGPGSYLICRQINFLRLTFCVLSFYLWGNDQEIEIQEIEIHIFGDFSYEIESFCKIVQEIEKASGALGGHYFRVFFILLNLTPYGS